MATNNVKIAARFTNLTVQDEGNTLPSSATTLNFVGAGVTASGNGEVKTITIPGGGGSGGTLVVQEGDVSVDASVGTLDFDGSDFNVVSNPGGEANISLNYGTGAGQPAEGNHAHSGADITSGTISVDRIGTGTKNGATFYAGDGTFKSVSAGGGSIIVKEENSNVDTVVTSLDFDGSDFNVSSSPAGEANVSLNYGTGAGQPAEGNHAHAHNTLTGIDTDTATTAIHHTLGTGANQAAAGNHNHSGTYMTYQEVRRMAFLGA